MTIATTAQEYTPRKYPEVIRYLGSRSKSLNFIGAGLAAVDAHGRTLVDLFAGSCAIAAGFGGKYRVVSNDIQKYSSVIAGAYLRRAKRLADFDLVGLASDIAKEKIRDLPEGSQYYSGATLAEFNRCEKKNRSLWEKKSSTSHHLFSKYYSGTWWSAEQCVYIDAMREVLDKLFQEGSILEADFDLGMTCLIHAVAEISTSATSGHYKQYREAKDKAGVDAISKCRRAKFWKPFNAMLATLTSWQAKQAIDLKHELFSLDYRDCLRKIENAVDRQRVGLQLTWSGRADWPRSCSM
jgi:adenine-specific DNA-methyltransferase